MPRGSSDYRWYKVIPPHKYSGDTNETRWSCDVSVADCSQNVQYDPANTLPWLQASTSQSECYSESATNPDMLACARYTCDPNTPFACTYYNESMNVGGAVPTLYTEETCGTS